VPATGRGAWPWLAAGALVAVLLVPAAVALLRQQWRVEGFDHTRSRTPDAQVAALLQGADLVPPPPVPPELFATREVALAHPLPLQANRDWSLLDAEFRRRLLGVFSLMQQRHGYELVLIEGWRSPQRQNQLAALGGHVTRATAHESQHQFGRAADVAFLREGRIVISEQDPWAARGYQLYGELAASFGLTWGGSWTSLRDLGHVEWRGAPLAASAALP
jgi:peptidoglycan L-alanyl-D-glutamate endopeptidase CwlK